MGPYVPFILDIPSEYNKRQQKKLVDFLESFVPQHRGETIIETGTDYTNYWGEALAQRIRAKHIVVFLDEQNERIDGDVIDFYKFKYSRREMACISKPVMHNLFLPYENIPLDRCYSLICNCTNSLEDYETPLTKGIEKSRYNIGYVGRLEKPFMFQIIDGFLQFATKHSEESITIVFFGGAFEYKTVRILEEQFKPFPNVKLHITGYIYPLPVKALQKMDVFVSGAGSATVAAKAGCLSVRIDVLDYKPIGIIQDLKQQKYEKCPNGDTVFDYLDWVLSGCSSVKPLLPDFANDWSVVCENFDKHMEFINESSNSKRYFDVSRLGVSKLRKKKKFIRSIIGLKAYDALHGSGLYRFVWNRLHHFQADEVQV